MNTTKQTTAEVAKSLKVSKQRIYVTLFHYPALRPAERIGSRKAFLWSEEEITALRVHLLTHAYKPHHKRSPFVR